MTNEEIYDHPEIALMDHADELTAEQFDYCVKSGTIYRSITFRRQTNY